MSIRSLEDRILMRVNGKLESADFDEFLKLATSVLGSNDVDVRELAGITTIETLKQEMSNGDKMQKRSIITGVCGQDGSYLAELLLECRHEVFGIYRRVGSGNNFENVKEIRARPGFHLIEGDITDTAFMSDLIKTVQPDFFYNLAAMSHVGHSFKIPAESFRVNAEAVLMQLEAIRQHSPKTRYYNAATSELCGNQKCPESGFNEDTVFMPRSPYAIAKLAAFHATRMYREAYGLYAVSGILFNHSSPRRPNSFATGRICNGVARIKLGLDKKLKMGNLDAVRDEGHAKDFVWAMKVLMEQEAPQDAVVATGETASIREMLEFVCSIAGLNIDDVYEADEQLMRPSDVPHLKGDSSRIRMMGWKPRYEWRGVLREMYEHQLNVVSRELQ